MFFTHIWDKIPQYICNTEYLQVGEGDGGGQIPFSPILKQNFGPRSGGGGGRLPSKTAKKLQKT